MDIKKGYIELTYEQFWKKPVQAYIHKQFHGKTHTYHFFAEWNSFEEAIKWLKHGHSKYEIIINRQSKVTMIEPYN
jgi:hypothetical protein